MTSLQGISLLVYIIIAVLYIDLVSLRYVAFANSIIIFWCYNFMDCRLHVETILTHEINVLNFPLHLLLMNNTVTR